MMFILPRFSLCWFYFAKLFEKTGRFVLSWNTGDTIDDDDTIDDEY